MQKTMCFRMKYSVSCLTAFRQQHQLAERNNESCIYPPIVDMSVEGQRRHQRQLWYDSIKAMPTVEEKLYELATQQRVGLKKYILSAVPPTYSSIFFQRYITRSHLIEGLPNKLHLMDVEKELSDVKDVFNEALHTYYFNPWQSNGSKQLSDYLLEKNAGAVLLNQMIAKCYKKLAGRNYHILKSTIQQKPRINSFWWHSGFESKHDRIYEKNICFKYTEFPAFVIRMKEPLSPIVEFDDPLCATADVPSYHYHPKVVGLPFKHNWLSSIPGFWPGDPCEFPLLQVLTLDKLQKLLVKIENYDVSKIEDSAAIMSSFGYLNATATYQGFTPFHDITYPLVAQTILTNGQDWKFYVYQLNTIAFHEDVDNKNRRNLCWASEKLRLFDTIEEGQVKGINEDVYRLLLKFLLNAPILKEGLDLKPYLGTDTRTEEEIHNMRYFFRKMYSQARAHDAHKKEVADWIRIYKNHPDAPPSPYVRLA
ncbi:39S ribosomal protein S30, mitochondrial [Trichonephila inaurata madagascariensis]|uniref:39S ribosomal protein S30, mitochondrial n=1 Tax=Trichonephila inaurata madagascariensis TaxID=2747483 RepID=A0A8X6XR26_9ARAC|nr:39S ribosomal protein S30, mitochondrial [Trichonephila inaurata madagascariensis]